MNVQIRTFKKDHCSVHIKRNIRHIRYLRKYQTRNTRTPSTSPNIWETTSYSSSKSILQITTLKQLKIWSSTKENKKKNRRIKKRVEHNSTSFDEAETRTKCVKLANISTTQRRRLYREQAMLLRFGKNSLWLTIRSPTFKMWIWLNVLNWPRS